MNQGPNGKAGGQSPSAPKQQFPCEYALRKKGADEAFVAEQLIDMLKAKRKRWNTATKSWESFEDYEVQLAALEQIAKLLGSYPTPKELEGRHKPHEVIISVVREQPRWVPKA